MALADGYDFALTISGVTYNFILPDATSIQRSDLTPFTSQSGAGLALSQETHFAAYEQTDFHGGMGQYNMIEESRYYESTGLDTRFGEAVALWADKVTDTITGMTLSASAPSVLVTADDQYLYIAGDGGVFYFDGTTVSDMDPLNTIAGSTITSMIHNGSYLLVGTQAGSIHRFDGDISTATFTWTAVNSRAHKARAFCIHDGYIWYSQGSSNLIHYSGKSDGSDLFVNTIDADHSLFDDGAGTDPDGDGNGGDPGAVQVGPEGLDVVNLISFNKVLYAFRDDGIWEILLEPTGDYVSYKLFDFSDLRSDTTYRSLNFRTALVWEGALFFNVGPKIYKYTGTTLTDYSIPESLGMDAWPPVQRGRVHHLYNFGSFLYAAVGDYLYSFDGVGWHRLELIATGVQWGQIAYYAPSDLLCYAYYTSGPNAILHQNLLAGDYATTPYASTGNLITSWFDGGYASLTKKWQKLRVAVRFNSSSVGSISFKFISQDSDGTTAEETHTVNSADLPAGPYKYQWVRFFKTFTLANSLKGIRSRIEITFTRSSGTDTPLLEGFLVEYIGRPETVWGYNLTVMLDDEARTIDGRGTYYSANDIYAILIDARNSTIPIYYEDYLGHAAYVYLTALNHVPLERNEDNVQTSDHYASAGSSHPIASKAVVRVMNINLSEVI